jgi:hypothetical protein
MQGSDHHANDLTRRGAMTVTGAAIAAATIPAAGAAFAQAPQAGATTAQETRPAPVGKNSVKLAHKRVTTNGVTLHYVTAGRGPGAGRRPWRWHMSHPTARCRWPR